MRRRRQTTSRALVTALVLAVPGLACAHHAGPDQLAHVHRSTPAAAPAPGEIQPVPATAETTATHHSGDSADDPAIWVDTADPARSLVIGNDKGPGPGGGELDTYDLTGALVQRITTPEGFWGNVDVRQGVPVGGKPTDLVAVTADGLSLFRVNPGTRQLDPITDGTIQVWGEGLCLYDSPATGTLYAFVVARSGVVHEVALGDADGDGLLGGHEVRTFDIGSEAEGCVVDDNAKTLYISQEDVALWRYGAEPDAGSARSKVDALTSAGGHLVNDIEGLTMTSAPDGTGHIFASAQHGDAPTESYFTVYQRQRPNAWVTSFRVTDGTQADDCDGTDGIAAYTGNLGPRYPHGLFVCQDNTNDAPGSAGNQDFKYVGLATIRMR